MIKLLGALMILLAFTSAGFYMAYRLKRRSEFLSAVLTLAASLETEIRYSRDDIMTLLSRCAPEQFSQIKPCSNSVVEYRRELLNVIPKQYCLRREDVAVVDELFSKLGTTDVEGQIAHLKLCGGRIKNNHNNSLEEIKSKSKLYKLLGFFAGAAVAVTVL